MHSRVRGTWLLVALCALAALWPAPVGAQSFILEWGSQGSGDGQFHDPQGVATDAAGNVYVVDSGNNRIQKFTNAGTYVTQWPIQGGTGTVFPWVAVDPAGNVYVSVGTHIEKYTSTGTLLTQWGSFGTGAGQFREIQGLGTYESGNVYATDYYNYNVQEFTSSGTYITQFGGPGEFLGPVGVDTDASGNVYVVDQLNDRIRKFGPGTTAASGTTWGRLKTLYRR
jgi:NHL repeat-containing protein